MSDKPCRDVKLRLSGAFDDVVSLVTALKMLPDADRLAYPHATLARLGIGVASLTARCVTRRNQKPGTTAWEIVLRVTDAPGSPEGETGE